MEPRFLPHYEETHTHTDAHIHAYERIYMTLHVSFCVVHFVGAGWGKNEQSSATAPAVSTWRGAVTDPRAKGVAQAPKGSKKLNKIDTISPHRPPK